MKCQLEIHTPTMNDVDAESAEHTVIAVVDVYSRASVAWMFSTCWHVDRGIYIFCRAAPVNAT